MNTTTHASVSNVRPVSRETEQAVLSAFEGTVTRALRFMAEVIEHHRRKVADRDDIDSVLGVFPLWP